MVCRRARLALSSGVLRSSLREYLPAALKAFDDLTAADTLACLGLPRIAASGAAVALADRRRAQAGSTP